MRILPNFVFIGPDKSGSTWLFHLLQNHHQVFVTPAKDLYFFDRFYGRGIQWYARQFKAGSAFPIRADISHDYLYGRRIARRVSEVLPAATLMTCLREPCDRAFSGYLHLVRNGVFRGSFEDAIQAHSGLVERGLYGKWISNYLDYFPRNQIYCGFFDLLRSNPQQFADDLCTALEIDHLPLSNQMRQQALPAGRSRVVTLTKVVKHIADGVRLAGFPSLVGRIKGSRLVQRILYSELSQHERPQPNPDTVARLRALYQPDIALLDAKLGTTLGQLWGYETNRAAECGVVMSSEPSACVENELIF